MYTYDVKIRLDGKRGAHLNVTQMIQRGDKIVNLGTCRREYVTTFFGDVEEKARRRAREIVDEWKKETEQKIIQYTI